MAIRRSVRMLLTLTFIAAVVGGTGGVAYADNTVPPSDTWVEIFPPNLGFFGGCLATSDSSGSDHARAVIGTCNYDNQSDPTWIRQVWSFG